METIILNIGLLGAFTCAISGALKAINKGFDPFGILIIGFVTSVGGGTLRDMLLTDIAVFWLRDAYYLYGDLNWRSEEIQQGLSPQISEQGFGNI